MRVDDMRRDDLDAIGWSGSASHLKNVAGQLDRRDRGVLEYLVVRDADGSPVAKGAIDYEEHPGAGSIMQLATRTDLEGRGLATMLIAAAERRILQRGLSTARLSVEPDNARALRLYEHLGFHAIGEREIGWEHELENGELGWYSTVVVDMEKPLQLDLDAVLEEQRAFYVADALDYDAWLRSLEDLDNREQVAVGFRDGRVRVESFLRQHAPLGTVLDVGAGTGILSELAVAAGARRVVLLDSSGPSLRLAATRLSGADPCEIELVEADVFTWTGGDAAFDTILFSSWFHHVPRRELGPFFETIDRLLSPAGQVLFDFPSAETAAVAQQGDLPGVPTHDYSIYAPTDGTSIRNHRGQRWTTVHELWSRDELVAALDGLGWTVTASVPGWWQHFEWLRLVRR